MKRTLAALALAVALVPPAARAQSSLVAQIAGDKAASEKLYFSLNFGLDFAYLVGSEVSSLFYPGRTGGFNIGLSATIRLTDRLSLVPEVVPFFPRGISEIPFNSTGDPGLDAAFMGAEDLSTALALSTLDVPVLVKYRLGRLEVGAGPYVAFLIAARERYQADLETGETVRFSRDVSERYKKTDYGLAAEASWTVTKPRRGLGLVLHGRYEHGFVDVLRTSGPFGGRNSVWRFFVSFPFVIK
jgi:Outer membrane protein beta-barrel domain